MQNQSFEKHNTRQFKLYNFLIPSILLILFTISSISINSSAQTPSIIGIDDPIEVIYFYQPGCDICEEKEPYFQAFEKDYPTLKLIRIAIEPALNWSWFDRTMKELQISDPTIPMVLFNKSSCYYPLRSNDITPANLNRWADIFLELKGNCPDWDYNDPSEFTNWAAFGVGFITGLSPCVILITAIMSSTLLVQEGKKKLLPIFTGFLLGVFLVYFLIGWALITTLTAVTATVFGPILRYTLAGAMCILGIWYIIDSFNENSKLFKTPDKFKKVFSTWAKSGTFTYSFLLGFIFSFLKVPCVGGPLLALMLNVANNPAGFMDKLIIFYIGMLVPLIILMGLIALGVKNNKLDEIRVKYRPLLRILSGLIIIGLTIYALFF
jgi:cytochrome c biogenesis protein CcdA